MAGLSIKRKALTLQEKLNVIRKVEANPNKTRVQIAKEFNMPVTTLNGIMAKKNVLYKKMEGASSNVKRLRAGKYYIVEEKLLEWFKQMTAEGVPIDGTIIRTKAVEIADRLNVEFTLSNGWIDRFRKRTGLLLKRISSKSQNVNPTEVWKTECLPRLLEGYKPCDIFSADECALFYNLLPDKISAFKGEKCHATKLRKERITVLVAANMDGSEKLPLLVIGKFEKPYCFKHIKTFPCKYRFSKMALMTSPIFEEFLNTLNEEMTAKKRNILLFVNDCAVHPKNVTLLSNIRVEFLSPNMISVVQPMNQGLIKCLKYHFRRRVIEKILQLIKVNSSTKNLKSFKLSVLDAMHFLSASWNLISARVIINCFRKAGFSEAPNEEDLDNQMEKIDETVWGMLQQDFNFSYSFEDFVAVDDALSSSVMSIDELCDESSEVEDTNEESAPVPVYSEVVKTIETLQEFLRNMSDVPESVMKSVCEIDLFITGLAQKHDGQVTLD